MFTCVALIPARSGSKRIPNKNIKKLGNNPLIAYTIAAAISSKLFTDIIVSTDSKEIANVAKKYGASVPFLRPKEFATDTSPDIEWVQHVFSKLSLPNTYDCFSILRPTSPFRSREMLQKAMKRFQSNPKADSLRAIEPCTQHPAKMWKLQGEWIVPVMEGKSMKDEYWHSTPYQSLPMVYAQNASLEIAWTRIPLQTNTIAGERILPFMTHGYEGYDINNEKDWVYAEHLLKSKKVHLPQIYLNENN